MIDSSQFRLPSFFSQSQEYLELERGDEGSEQSSLDSSRPQITYRRSYLLSLFINVFLSVAVVVLLFFNESIPWRSKDAKELIRATSTTSPVLDKTTLTLVEKVVNGSFFSETDPPDIFRALPSPEVDKAWHKIGKPTWMTISASEAVSLNKDPSQLVRAPADWGHGPGRYIAMLDLNHQLHCIDQLRRAAFRDEYPVNLSDSRGSFTKEHWMHCVHILYQNVMCTGSTEVITYNWRETQHFPVPDFDVGKVCRNSETLLDFQDRERIVNMDRLRDEMERPSDAVVLPLPPRLKAFLEEADEEQEVD